MRFSFARRLPLPASAPASAPVSAARCSVGGLARACEARHARARLRRGRGGGGGDGARRGGRLVVFLAPRVARCCTGAGSVWELLRFFFRSVRTPDARGRSDWSSGRWVGALWRNRASKMRAIDYFCLPGGGSLARLEPVGLSHHPLSPSLAIERKSARGRRLYGERFGARRSVTNANYFGAGFCGKIPKVPAKKKQNNPRTFGIFVIPTAVSCERGV